MSNIILTGIPRSGTTLACKLLCDFPNTIALNEPMDGIFFDSKEKAYDNIASSFKNFRTSLFENGEALARTKDGNITDNVFDHSHENRKAVVKRTKVYFDKTLKKDFVLVMKHCSQFTLLLPELQNDFKCFGMIRNPLAILASWNSVSVPVSKGRVAKSKQLLPTFYHQIDSKTTLLEKQLFILNWYFEQMNTLPPAQILKYETLIASQGKSLSVIAKTPISSKEPLNNQNYSTLYDKEFVVNLGENLLKQDGVIWSFYTKKEVEELIAAYSE